MSFSSVQAPVVDSSVYALEVLLKFDGTTTILRKIPPKVSEQSVFFF